MWIIINVRTLTILIGSRVLGIKLSGSEQLINEEAQVSKQESLFYDG